MCVWGGCISPLYILINRLCFPLGGETETEHSSIWLSERARLTSCLSLCVFVLVFTMVRVFGQCSQCMKRLNYSVHGVNKVNDGDGNLNICSVTQYIPNSGHVFTVVDTDRG